eukprot:m.168841 g.168841  ORF g.168841 m.168841 type:complete len:71 (+) comp16468_c2_seq1:118-330(+)
MFDCMYLAAKKDFYIGFSSCRNFLMPEAIVLVACLFPHTKAYAHGCSELESTTKEGFAVYRNFRKRKYIL